MNEIKGDWMVIEQKKGKIKHIFTFHEDSFRFEYDDKDNAGEFDIYYANLPTKPVIYTDCNEGLKYAGCILSAMGMVEVLMFLIHDVGLPGGKGTFLFGGIIMFLWYKLSKIRYSVLETEQVNVFVLSDKKHDEILLELYSRKKKQLRDLYGKVVIENDLENEIEKFNWLCDEQAITDSERDELILSAELVNRDKALKKW